LSYTEKKVDTTVNKDERKDSKISKRKNHQNQQITQLKSKDEKGGVKEG